jgi:hypothetical protein
MPDLLRAMSRVSSKNILESEYMPEDLAYAFRILSFRNVSGGVSTDQMRHVTSNPNRRHLVATPVAESAETNSEKPARISRRVESSFLVMQEGDF